MCVNVICINENMSKFFGRILYNSVVFKLSRIRFHLTNIYDDKKIMFKNIYLWRFKLLDNVI